MKRREKGLTLIELMVTLAVAIVLLAIGIPAFNAMTARDMSAATVNALVTALQLARMEAISRGNLVNVVSADWNTAWSVQLPDGTPLRAFTAPRPAQVAVSNTANAGTLTFSGRGELSAPAAAQVTFSVTAYKIASKVAANCTRKKSVIVTRIGQIRSEDATCP